MKRLIFIIGLAFAFLGLQAQDAVVKDGFGRHTANKTVSGTTEQTVTFLVDVDYIYRYAFQVQADSAGDGTDITVRIKGSNDGTNFINVGDAVTYGVTSTDTVINFTNVPTSESHGVASHTVTTAATADYHAYDTTNLTGGVYADTVTVGARVNTVAAQTITITTQWPVMYRYLRVSFTGAGAGAGATIDATYLVVRRD